MGGGKAATRHGPLKPHYQGHFRPISAAAGALTYSLNNMSYNANMAGTAEGAKERKTISLKLAKTQKKLVGSALLWHISM